jgi:DNA polymerase-3 subunit epsilon
VASALPPCLAFVDLETTGARTAVDKITEIAILRVEDGREVGRWQSLVQPGRAISSFAVQLTGISNAMVAEAPRFAELADTVTQWLDGCVFVAHNASFDRGFLARAFTNLGQTFDPRVLCTLKLARALYPGHHRHGLDALIERHGLVCSARHRAMGDVEALWQFVQGIEHEFAPDVIGAALKRVMRVKKPRGTAVAT